MSIRIGSFCSGIGAPEKAWSALDWEPRWFSEIDPFACAVLAHHYPDVPNLGDMTKLHGGEIEPVDVVVAGTPCQSFSVAGLRKGLADPRGNLALVFLGLVDAIRPRWLVWENVPGILSSGSGRDFGSFLGALGQLGYGWAYRVLDAQHFGVPQRRRRVFVVGCLGNWQRAAAVLFERHCLSGHPAPSREAGERIASSLTRGADSSGQGGYAGRRREDDSNIVVNTLDAHMGGGGADDNAAQTNHLIAHCNGVSRALTACHTATGRLDPNEMEFVALRAMPIIPILEVGKGSSSCGEGPNGCGIGEDRDPMYTLQAGAQHAVAFGWNKSSSQSMRVADTTNPLQASSTSNPAIAFQCHGSNVGEMGTLRQGNGDVTGGVPFTVFDTTQITSEQKEHDGRLQIQMRQVRADDLRAAESRRDSEGVGIGGPLSELRPVAFQSRFADNGRGAPSEVAYALTDHGSGGQTDRRPQVLTSMAVRRLTPKECLRLQGFPDDYLDITYRNKPAADGPKYRAIGNSMAVPVLRWIGERIALVEGGVR